MSNYYDMLGVRKVINGWGNSTVLGGSSPAPEVRQAMEEAHDYVEMGELLQRTGDYIADVLGVEAAYITSGGAAAQALSAAACMAGTDPEKIGRLPDTTGMKNELVIQKKHRYRYDRSYTIAGAKLVDAGDSDGCSPEQLDGAIGPDTAAVTHRLGQPADDALVAIGQAVEIAHDHGVPVIADAAAEIYPLDHFRRSAQSADLVCFCSKYFNAPQSTGFVSGSKEMVDKVTAQGFAAFHTAGKGLVAAMVPDGRAWGRPMKVDRQEIIGAVAALRAWFSMDHEERLAGYATQLAVIQRELDGIRGVEAQVVSVRGYWRSELHISLDGGAVSKTAPQVAAELDSGNPRVWVAFYGDRTIVIKPHGLNDGDEQILAERLKASLTG